MIAMIVFSVLAASLVYLAGRNDKARDPRLTVLTLGLLAVFPLLGLLLPKWEGLPALPGSEPAAGFAMAVGTGVDWSGLLLGLWAAATAVGIIRLGLAARGVSRWKKTARKLGEADGVQILALQGLKGPVATGVIWPAIFVPPAWETWTRETRAMVLAHELAHHRRRDPLWRWVAEIACAVNVYNPLVLWMARRLALQSEYACDAEVIGTGIPAGRYARLLCDLAESRSPSGPVLAMAVGPTLESRVRRLMARPAGKKGSAGVVILISIALALAGAMASIQRAHRVEVPVTQKEVEQRFSAEAFSPDEGGPPAATEAGEPEFATEP